MLVFGTAGDVLIMAIRMKGYGRVFYGRAAKMSDDPVVKKVFQDLAMSEECHIQCFSSLRTRLLRPTVTDMWDHEGPSKSYLEAVADTHIFAEGVATEPLKRTKTPLEALDMAIQFEKDTMHFLVGMKEMIRDPHGKREIDKLVCEDMDHVRMLSQAKTKCLPTECEIIS